MERYSVVYRRNGREIGRSRGMGFEEALAKVRVASRANQDRTWKADRNAPYVETTASVKHLPVLDQ